MKGDDNVKEIMKWHDQGINPDPDHSSITCTYNYVIVNFLSQVIFVFLLFLTLSLPNVAKGKFRPNFQIL